MINDMHVTLSVARDQDNQLVFYASRIRFAMLPRTGRVLPIPTKNVKVNYPSRLKDLNMS